MINQLSKTTKIDRTLLLIIYLWIGCSKAPLQLASDGSVRSALYGKPLATISWAEEDHYLLFQIDGVALGDGIAIIGLAQGAALSEKSYLLERAVAASSKKGEWLWDKEDFIFIDRVKDSRRSRLAIDTNTYQKLAKGKYQLYILCIPSNGSRPYHTTIPMPWLAEVDAANVGLKCNPSKLVGVDWQLQGSIAVQPSSEARMVFLLMSREIDREELVGKLVDSKAQWPAADPMRLNADLIVVPATLSRDGKTLEGHLPAAQIGKEPFNVIYCCLLVGDHYYISARSDPSLSAADTPLTHTAPDQAEGKKTQPRLSKEEEDNKTAIKDAYRQAGQVFVVRSEKAIAAAAEMLRKISIWEPSFDALAAAFQELGTQLKESVQLDNDLKNIIKKQDKGWFPSKSNNKWVFKKPNYAKNLGDLDDVIGNIGKISTAFEQAQKKAEASGRQEEQKACEKALKVLETKKKLYETYFEHFKQNKMPSELTLEQLDRTLDEACKEAAAAFEEAAES